MSKVYQITVSEAVPDGDGDGGYNYTTVLELFGPAEMLAKFAPGAVAETLGAPVTIDATAGSAVVDTVRETSEVTSSAAVTPTEPEAPKQSRPRRTKAQIAADKQAQAAGYRDAAHMAEVLAAEQAQGPTGNGDADLAAAAEAAVNEATEAQRQLPPPPTVNGYADAAVPAATGTQVITTLEQARPIPAAAPAVPPPLGAVTDQPWNPFK